MESFRTLKTCPECHGVLVRLIEGKFIRFRCHTGHAYTASSLLADLSENVEETLWQAMRGLEETTLLLTQISEHFKQQGLKDAAAIFTGKAEMTTKRARVIHDSVFTQQLLSEDLRHSKSKPKKNIKKVSAINITAYLAERMLFWYSSTGTIKLTPNDDSLIPAAAPRKLCG